jgi:hypothetical protein
MVEASTQEQVAVAAMCSVAVLIVGTLAAVGGDAAAAAGWKVALLLPWYLVQGLYVVATALA